MSVIAKELKNYHELSEFYIEEGFRFASKAGELLKEIQSMTEKENLTTWLKQNCSEITEKRARSYIRFFEGEKLKLEAFIQQIEEVEE